MSDVKVCSAFLYAGRLADYNGFVVERSKTYSDRFVVRPTGLSENHSRDAYFTEIEQVVAYLQGYEAGRAAEQQKEGSE